MAVFGFQKAREEIKRRLSEIFEFEARDPRLALVTVMDVKLSKDMRYATVFVSATDSGVAEDEVLKVLQEHRGFFRSELGKRIRLRHIPELRFEIDLMETRAQRIDKLLRGEPVDPESSTSES